MRVRILPDSVINQIAAGEVVERPASVVRELVDNAVDSGATEVFIAIEGGGQSRIRVRDNGCGMSRDEALLAFERHATSKVSAIEDVWHLSTMGFRGEALPSIASVSKVKLTTRAEGSDVGAQVIIRGGKLISVESCPWSEGTEIEVEHLFFNTPARRKFLKSPRAEFARIRTWILHSSLTRPAVRYRLVSDGDEVVHLPPASSIEARARTVFADGLMPFRISEGGVSVEGMVAHPGLALGDTSGLVILINGRLVTDRIVSKAVREGFDSMLKDREFPVGYVVIALPPEHLDVNVHPQKSEVRFRHADQIFAVVRGAVLGAVRSIKAPVGTSSASSIVSNVIASSQRQDLKPLREATSLGSHNSDEPLYQSQKEEDRPDSEGLFLSPAPTPPPPFPWDQITKRVDASPLLREAAPLFSLPFDGSAALEVNHEVRREHAFRFSELRYIGQLLGCYLLCQHEEALVVVDMHAAHERVNYNKIRSARAEHTLKCQALLIPQAVRLTEEQAVHLSEQAEALRELAFDFELTDTNEITLRGIPATLSHIDCTQLLKEFAVEPVSAGFRERLEERIDHIAARLACHASVRSGDLLNREEVYALFHQLDRTDLAGACPHGRPVVAEFARETVERWFGRDR